MTLEANQQYSMALASEKGASSWLTALPLKRYGFDLTKTEFRDGLSLRYGLQPKNLPLKCSCGEDFTVSHALHCGKGYTHMRHNEIRDTFAKIMRDDAYKQHESQKKLKYEQRIIDVEHSTFNPLVFACTGGAGPSASKVMSRLALKISEKGYDSYSDAISFIRTKISFALLRSSVLCLRGCRALKRQIDHFESSIAATVQEGRLS